MDLYQAEILEHYRHPLHRGVLDTADVVQREHNPTCGDTLTFYLQFQDDVITNITWEGEGCAISQAAASLLTDEIIGLTRSQIAAMQKEDVLKLLGIELGPTRLKCALLSLQGVTHAVNQKTNSST